MDLPPSSGGPLSQPARSRIFAFLSSRRAAADTGEIAAHLGLHPNGVRRHLERLHEDGLLERRRLSAGRGRPRDAWSVAPGARPGGSPPRAYAELAAWLARAIPATPSRIREVERSGREIGREIGAGTAGEPADALRDAFAALGFEPQMEEREGGFSCRLGNCPFRAAVRENREAVCGLHRGITAGLLGELAPGGKLTRFEPRDPETAGCLVEATLPGSAEGGRTDRTAG